MANSITLLQEVGSGNALSQLLCSDDISTLKLKPGDYLQADIKVISGSNRKRSALMNRCVHKYCRMLADAWNAYGLECVVCMIGADGKQFDLKTAWTEILVKEMVFKPTLNAISGRHSTAKASDKDLCEVEEKLGRMCAKKMGLVVEWPTSKPPAWRS